MRKIQTIAGAVVASMVSASVAMSVAAAQTVPTCTPAVPCTIQWIPNSEPDMKEYRVLLSKTAGQYDAAKPAAVIIHPAASGSTAKVGTLDDGQHFLVVVAVDQVGNVSAYSNEVTFRFDGPPGGPVIELIKATIP